MLDKVNYGHKDYAMHEVSFASENEFHQNSSMQMMPPPPPPPPYPPQYLKQPMFMYGHHGGAYPDGGCWNAKAKHQSGWHNSSNMHQNGYYHCPPTGPMVMAPGRMPSNNMMMMNAEYETYQPGPPRRMRMQNYGTQYESHDDFASGMHNGRQKVEWKNL